MAMKKELSTLDFKCSIYVPTTVGSEPNELLGQRFAESIANRFAYSHGGASIEVRTGFYKMCTGDVVKEKNYIVHCFCDNVVGQYLLLDMCKEAKKICIQFEQECVAIEYDGKLVFVECSNEEKESTDYVIIDRDGEIVRFGDGEICIYGEKKEAESDAGDFEKVTPVSELPIGLKIEISAWQTLDNLPK